jgi:hypothetical protein
MPDRTPLPRLSVPTAPRSYADLKAQEDLADQRWHRERDRRLLEQEVADRRLRRYLAVAWLAVVVILILVFARHGSLLVLPP